MKRVILALGTVCLLAGAAAVAVGFKPNGGSTAAEFDVLSESRNPWTNLNLNNDPAEFQFAVVSDRTGGHRAKVFSRAVDQLNLLQPEFVVSVGDLIEGYSEDAQKLADEWRQFQSYVCRLQMPFFYVPGNHDIANPFEERIWKEKFGRRYYHFVYRNVLFLVLDSEDPPGINAGSLSEAQLAYVRKVCQENDAVRWTFVFLHKPMWTGPELEKNGWLEAEKALGGRPFTVFAGHIHRYQRFVRNGRHYYQLATTGGVSKMRGLDYGEFDHLVWVTVKKNQPVLANILVDGVLSDELKRPDSEETGVVEMNRQPTHPVRGKVFFEGTPLAGAYVVLQTPDPKAKPRIRADAMTEADGSLILSTYAANDGVPAGDYAVTVVQRKPFYTEDGKPGPNMLPERYAQAATSGLKALVKTGNNELVLELQK